MSTEFSEFMSENRVDLNQIDINKLKELVETNMMNLQDNFNSLFQVLFLIINLIRIVIKIINLLDNVDEL